MLKNKLWQLVGAIVVLLIAVVVMVNSCGSSDSYDQWGGMSKEEWMAEKKKSDQSQKAEEDAAKKKKNAARAEKTAKKPAKPKSKKPARTRDRSEADNSTSEELLRRRKKENTKSDMPDDFADWEPDDYYAARREEDALLSKAVDYLGKQAPDKNLAVEILVKLLEPPSDSAAVNSAKKRKAANKSKIIEAIVAALADNGAPAAWETIERLALGKIAAEEPKAAAFEAVKMLIEHPSPANEEALLRVVVAAAQPIPDGYGREEAVELNNKVIALVRTSALEPFRNRLASYIVSPEISRQAFEKLWPCIQNGGVENLIPQVIVFQSNHLSKTDSEKIEKRLLPESNAALWRLFGVPPEPIRGKKTATVLSTNYPALADPLWSPDFASAVERKLLVVDTLDKGKDLLSLAGSLPLGSVRGALHRTLELHWEEKPAALEKAGFGADMVPEPGFLVVLKMLPRKDRPNDGSRSAAKRPANSRASLSKGAALLDARRRRDEIAYEWMEFSKKTTLAMCRRFCAAAMARTGAELLSAEDVDSDRLPVKPHPGAEIVALYRSSWPNDIKNATERLAALPPLRIHYIRIEQRAKPKTVLGYYQRQLPGHEAHEIGEGAWLDSLATSPEQSLVRSIDVLITSPGVEYSDLANREQRLVVEILSVECEPVKTVF